MNGGNNIRKFNKFEEQTSNILIEDVLTSFLKGLGQLTKATGLTKDAPFQINADLSAFNYSNKKKYYPNILKYGGAIAKKQDKAMLEFEQALNSLPRPSEISMEKCNSPDNDPRYKAIMKEIEALDHDITSAENSLPQQMFRTRGGSTLSPEQEAQAKKLKEYIAEFELRKTALIRKKNKYYGIKRRLVGKVPPMEGIENNIFSANGKIFKDKWQAFIEQVKLVFFGGSRFYIAGVSLDELLTKSFGRGERKQYLGKGQHAPISVIPEQGLNAIHNNVMIPIFVKPQIMLYMKNENYAKISQEGGYLKRGAVGAWSTFQNVATKIPTVKL